MKVHHEVIVVDEKTNGHLKSIFKSRNQIERIFDDEEETGVDENYIEESSQRRRSKRRSSDGKSSEKSWKRRKPKETTSYNIVLPHWMNVDNFPDFLLKGTLYNKLWAAALSYQADLKTQNRTQMLFSREYYDYIDDIFAFITTSTHTAQSQVIYCCDFQIIDNKGKVVKEDKLKTLTEAHLTRVSAGYAICSSSLCKKCDYKSGDKNVLNTVCRHIHRLLGFSWHCIACNQVFPMKTTLQKHSESCPYRERVARENILTKKFKEKKSLRSKKPIQGFDEVVLTPTLTTLEEKFENFISLLILRLKNRNVMDQAVKVDQVMDKIKENTDFNLIQFYIDNIYKFEVDVQNVSNYGDFYGIYLDNSDQTICSDPKKSRRFFLLDCKAMKTVSIHVMTKQRTDIINSNIENCNYKDCVCNSTYMNEPELLVGHVLGENFLIVCDGCKRGYSDWTTFSLHFNSACFIDRQQLIVKPNARINHQ